jgi:hypothetical protein
MKLKAQFVAFIPTICGDITTKTDLVIPKGICDLAHKKPF